MKADVQAVVIGGGLLVVPFYIIWQKLVGQTQF